MLFEEGVCCLKRALCTVLVLVLMLVKWLIKKEKCCWKPGGTCCGCAQRDGTRNQIDGTRNQRNVSATKEMAREWHPTAAASSFCCRQVITTVCIKSSPSCLPSAARPLFLPQSVIDH